MMMPFACSINCIRIPHIQKICNLRTKKNIELDLFDPDSDQKVYQKASGERVSSFIKHRYKGSLTIETALVLPIFLFAMMLIVMLSDALCLYMTIQGALHQNAKEAAQAAYDQPPDADILCSKVIEDIGIEYLERAPIESGSRGLRFDEARVGESDLIDLVVQYQLKFPYDYFEIGSIPMMQRCLIHEWVGYGGGLHANTAGRKEEYVYVTPHGTVYHRSQDCSHIRLSIREVSADQIGDLRNTDGGKYKSCEICDGSLDSAHIYITDDGDRYHSGLTCSGLKRDVMAILISEVGSRRPCSRCGGR